MFRPPGHLMTFLGLWPLKLNTLALGISAWKRGPHHVSNLVALALDKGHGSVYRIQSELDSLGY